MALALKDYQQRCLDVLRGFFREAAKSTPQEAYHAQPEHRGSYRDAPGIRMEGLPYICLRVPTGGGKTLLAASSIVIAAREFLYTERPTVLWLAPTTAIVEQTIRALSNHRHPYRLALAADFGGDIEVLRVAEALRVTPATLSGAATIIVSTLAAFRVEEREGRKVYDTNGSLMSHFTSLLPQQEATLQKNEDGVVVKSLENVLRLHRPLVIVDEAHNAKGELSFEMLERFRPSCILEFTATPAANSNVLIAVTAAELKAEHMVKLPIRLVARPQWKEAVGSAVTKQRELERIAKLEQATTGEYIRPIVLLQAQPRSENEHTVTVEELRKCLQQDFNIADEEIAESTGRKSELPDDLMKPGPVRFILTVAKLRESWDCPFAYILCSVSNLSSATAVEQILGRVLRLPNAKQKANEELNRAYAFATSDDFTKAAHGLAEALVDSGFTKFEAQQAVEREPGLPFEGFEAPLFPAPVTEEFRTAPDLERLPESIRNRITTQSYDDQTIKITYSGPPLSREEQQSIASACAMADRDAAERLARRSRGEPVYPAAMGKVMAIPQLAFREEEGGRLAVFDDQFKEIDWDIAECDANLSETEFNPSDPASAAHDLDIDPATGRVRVDRVSELHQQLSLTEMRGPKSKSELIAWLDRNLDREDRHFSTRAQTVIFLHKALKYLIERRGMRLEDLLEAKFRLRDALNTKIHSLLLTAQREAFQALLLPTGSAKLEVSPEICFVLPQDGYMPTTPYEGIFTFKKHFYGVPAEMNIPEEKVANGLDLFPEVEFWVRNLVRAPSSFWLPTSSDKFYPDFVAKLTDGRYLAVESKGEDRRGNPDSLDKKTIGKAWESRSNGACLFRMVYADDFDAVLRAAVQPISNVSETRLFS